MQDSLHELGPWHCWMMGSSLSNFPILNRTIRRRSSALPQVNCINLSEWRDSLA